MPATTTSKGVTQKEDKTANAHEVTDTDTNIDIDIDTDALGVALAVELYIARTTGNKKI